MAYLFYLSFDLFQIWQQINQYQNTPLRDKFKKKYTILRAWG